MNMPAVLYCMVLGIVPFVLQEKRTKKHFLQIDTACGKLGLYIHEKDIVIDGRGIIHD